MLRVGGRVLVVVRCALLVVCWIVLWLMAVICLLLLFVVGCLLVVD